MEDIKKELTSMHLILQEHTTLIKQLKTTLDSIKANSTSVNSIKVNGAVPIKPKIEITKKFDDYPTFKWKETTIDEAPETEIETLSLQDNILQNLKREGYEKERKCPLVLKFINKPFNDGNNVVLESSICRDTILSCCIAVLQRLNNQREDKKKINGTSALILSPVHSKTDYLDEMHAIGKKSVEDISRRNRKKRGTDNKRKSDIIIGTPTQISFNITNDNLSLANVKIVIIDEVDEMIRSFNLKNSLNFIMASVPENVQVLCTITRSPSQELCKLLRFIVEPYSCLIVNQMNVIPMQNLQQYVVYVDGGQSEENYNDHPDLRLEVIKQFYDLTIGETDFNGKPLENTKFKSLIFSWREIRPIRQCLKTKNFFIDSITPYSRQNENMIVKRFRRGTPVGVHVVLTNSDKFSRRIVKSTNVLINYSITSTELYKQRISRVSPETVVITIVEKQFRNRMETIQDDLKKYNITINECTIEDVAKTVRSKVVEWDKQKTDNNKERSTSSSSTSSPEIKTP